MFTKANFHQYSLSGSQGIKSCPGVGGCTPLKLRKILRDYILCMLHKHAFPFRRIPFVSYFHLLVSQIPAKHLLYIQTTHLQTSLLLHYSTSLPPSFNIGKPTKWQQELNKMTAGTDYRKGIERCFQRTMESILDFDRVYTDRVLEFLDFLAWCMRVLTFQGT